jgi:hypothetical protein
MLVVWNHVPKLPICTPFSISSAIVLVVDECGHEVIVICINVVDPPCLAIKKFVRPLYIVLRRFLSLNEFVSCLPMHLRYKFLKENVSIPKSLCSNCVVRFGVLLRTWSYI